VLINTRHHYYEDIQPYICLHAHCGSRDIRYSTLEEWNAHIRSSHGQVFRCLFGCTQTITTRSTFEDHLRAEHRTQFTDAELPTLIELCKKHQLNNIATRCPFCGEVLASAERYYQHLANHMEDLALLSLMPSLPCEFSTNVDVVPAPSETVAPDVVQKTTALDRENNPLNAKADDLPALFSSQPGFQSLVLSESDSNPTSTIAFTVEFTDLLAAYKAAYKFNHYPIPASNSDSPNTHSRLSIKLASNTLKVRITSDAPPPDAQLLPSIDPYAPTESRTTTANSSASSSSAKSTSRQTNLIGTAASLRDKFGPN
jgi:hypothetical protein